MVTSNRRKRTVSPDSAPATLTTPPTPDAAPVQAAETPAPKEPEVPKLPKTEEAAPAVAGKKGKKTEQTAAAETAASASGPEQDASLEHGRHVAFLADRLFDELAELHGLGKKWRRRLHLAALLHDIGFAEGRRKHHKISMRRIETDTTLGIADKDRPLVALLARYHRKAWPSQKHRRFADLSGKKRDAICKAAALLRIADGLDYRHLGNIQDVSVEVTDSAIRLQLRSCGECAPEQARAVKKGDLLEHLTERTLECTCREA
ncbi:MAG TPA: HD domain-containing protein [Candidatus Desulfovibrio intestinigallinarum]|nr:HD domain-containing protein [Candidatus Desulfovibrio intestinigallinarum]